MEHFNNIKQIKVSQRYLVYGGFFYFSSTTHEARNIDVLTS